MSARYKPEKREEGISTNDDASQEKKQFKEYLYTLSALIKEQQHLLYLVAVLAVVFAIGIAVGYAARGGCGQDRYDQMDKTLKEFLENTLNHKIDNKLEDISGQFDKLLVDQTSKMEVHHSTIRVIGDSLQYASTNIKNIVGDIDSVASNMKTSQSDLTKHVDIFNVQTNKISADMSNTKQGFVSTMETLVEEVKSTQKQSEKELKDLAESTTLEIGNNVAKLHMASEKSIQQFQTSTYSLNDNMAKFVPTIDSITKSKDELSTIVSTTTLVSADLKASNATLSNVLANFPKAFCQEKKGHEADLHYVGWVLIGTCILLLGIIYSGVKSIRCTAFTTGGFTQPQQVPQVPAKRSLSSLGDAQVERLQPPTGPPKYELSIVTFSEETSDRAKLAFPQMLAEAWPGPGKISFTGEQIQASRSASLIQSATVPRCKHHVKAQQSIHTSSTHNSQSINILNLLTGYQIIKLLTGELDLSRIPPSRAYIVVIGYDARNSILEDMDGSMGSRKRQTIVGLQNTKRDVLVIYIDSDRQLPEPPEGALYNTHLDRPMSHPILRPLVLSNCFLSLRHWRANVKQADRLKAWVRDLK